VRQDGLGLIVRRMRYRDVRCLPLFDEALEKCIAQPTPRVLQVPPLASGLRSNILASNQKLQPKRPRQLCHEGRVAFGLCAAQLVIEVHNRQRDTQVVAQAIKQAQQRHRVGASRHSYAHTVARRQHPRRLHACQYGLFQRNSHRPVPS